MAAYDWDGRTVCALNCLSESVLAIQQYEWNAGGRHFYGCNYAVTEGLEVVVLNDL